LEARRRGGGGGKIFSVRRTEEGPGKKGCNADPFSAPVGLFFRNPAGERKEEEEAYHLGVGKKGIAKIVSSVE